MKLYFSIIALIILIPFTSYAECDATATGKICVGFAYSRDGMAGGEHTLVVEDYIHATGHYGGGCKTWVGRRKARRRACAKLKDSFYADYSTWKGQADFVCRMAISSRGFPEAEELREIAADYQWLRIDKFKLINTKNGNGDRCSKSEPRSGSITPKPKVKAQSIPFYCRSGQAFMY